MLRIEPRTLYKLRKHSTSQVQKLFNTAAIEITLKIEGSEVGNCPNGRFALEVGNWSSVSFA